MTQRLGLEDNRTFSLTALMFLVETRFSNIVYPTPVDLLHAIEGNADRYVRLYSQGHVALTAYCGYSKHEHAIRRLQPWQEQESSLSARGMARIYRVITGICRLCDIKRVTTS